MRASRLGDETPKTGERMKGKPAPKKVTYVEEVACPASNGNHSLINVMLDEQEVVKTYCEFCDESWAALDLAVNKRKKKEE